MSRLEIATSIAAGLLASGHYTKPPHGHSPPDYERDEIHDKKGNIIGTQPAVVTIALIIADHLIKQAK